MRHLLVLPFLAALAACNPASKSAEASPDAAGESEAVAGLSPVPDLAGEFRVAGIDGAPLDLPFGLALSVSKDRIVFDAACGGYAWNYRLVGRTLRTTRIASPDPKCLATARIHHVVFDLAVAVDAATGAGRDGSNAIVLSGGGRTLTLYSQ
ncbi:MAG: hypothetical protein NBV68_05230 [Erythrobacter sp.]|uniref:hypothetical protein n=1 Tax=Erythrobacter sp. TaxID=1042 RepID=UPI0025F801BA|nr:hypothetical protein [Erythrobacter sp.]MCL9998761.1 hypothetical protein [Erythrobacter sp.]